jgi:hypothetical protein
MKHTTSNFDGIPHKSIEKLLTNFKQLNEADRKLLLSLQAACIHYGAREFVCLLLCEKLDLAEIGCSLLSSIGESKFASTSSMIAILRRSRDISNRLYKDEPKYTTKYFGQKSTTMMSPVQQLSPKTGASISSPRRITSIGKDPKKFVSKYLKNRIIYYLICKRVINIFPL